MAQPQFKSFEEQLQQEAEQLNFKPSSKVWQGVENSLNNKSTLGAGASVAKSLLGNWVLNLLVPAVVLVGGGSIFYANYSSEIVAAKESNATELKSVTTESIATQSESKENKTAVVTVDNESTSSQKEVAVASSIKSISDNQNNANAVNYSLGYGNNSNTQATKTNNLANLINSLNKKDVVEQQQNNSSNTNIVFTNSDIEKISKKEMEKNTKSEYQERNTKSVDFTE
jgi:hypothetical protein